jgi:hypothetical protein
MEALLWIRQCDREERVLEAVSCVLGSEEKGRSELDSCATGLIEFGRVL